MSITLPTTFIVRISSISPGAIKTYLCLSRIKASKKPYPTQPDIAQYMNASQRSVVTYLNELEQAGHIEKRRIGSGRKIDYVLLSKPVYES
jgi:DNA-binding MarR family transcriptional regulator